MGGSAGCDRDGRPPGGCGGPGAAAAPPPPPPGSAPCAGGRAGGEARPGGSARSAGAGRGVRLLGAGCGCGHRGWARGEKPGTPIAQRGSRGAGQGAGWEAWGAGAGRGVSAGAGAVAADRSVPFYPTHWSRGGRLCQPSPREGRLPPSDAHFIQEKLRHEKGKGLSRSKRPKWGSAPDSDSGLSPFASCPSPGPPCWEPGSLPTRAPGDPKGTAINAMRRDGSFTGALSDLPRATDEGGRAIGHWPLREEEAGRPAGRVRAWMLRVRLLGALGCIGPARPLTAGELWRRGEPSAELLHCTRACGPFPRVCKGTGRQGLTLLSKLECSDAITAHRRLDLLVSSHAPTSAS
ncbi:uncharacterized protein LOC141583959 [Saimiri boliviensis]|uniref:uncharacterized protein LOC141583959 n=1 Tax=Saimiri boliviensis TaxID=27679 RepID=UPI003D781653